MRTWYKAIGPSPLQTWRGCAATLFTKHSSTLGTCRKICRAAATRNFWEWGSPPQGSREDFGTGSVDDLFGDPYTTGRDRPLRCMLGHDVWCRWHLQRNQSLLGILARHFLCDATSTKSPLGVRPRRLGGNPAIRPLFQATFAKSWLGSHAQGKNPCQAR